MRKTVSLLLCLLMLTALVPTFALAEVLPPDVACVQGHITEEGRDYSIAVEGTARNGGALSYLWYETETGNVQDIIAIGAKTGNEITTPYMKVDTSAVGTFYYVCMVTETFEGGETFAYSPVIKVQVDVKNEPLGIEVIQRPAKLDYTVGDSVDISGIRVRLHTTHGDVDMTDIEDYGVSPAKLTKAGNHTVTITYFDMKTTYTVRVSEKEEAAPETQEADEEKNVLLIAEDGAAADTAAAEESSGGAQWWVIAIPAALLIAAAFIMIKKKK